MCEVTDTEYWRARWGNTGSWDANRRDLFRAGIENLDPLSIMEFGFRRCCLDFGGGDGRFKPYLRSRAHCYRSVDIVKVGDAAVWDGADLPWESRSFDLIWCCVVLQHITDDVKAKVAISEFSRVSESGTLLCVTDVVGANDTERLKCRGAGWYRDRITHVGFDMRSIDQIELGGEPHAVMKFVMS